MLEAYRAFAGDQGGHLSQAYPALASSSPDLFGLSVVELDGTTHSVGAADFEFTMMSLSKPFVYALLCREIGAAQAGSLIGVDATGLSFNSLEAIERSPDGRTNPMVNPGAIAATSLLPGDGEAKWDILLAGLEAFAGKRLQLDHETYRCASETNKINRLAAQMLHSRGLLGCDPDLALDLYTRQCCLRVTATTIAVMGATLADGGTNPVSGKTVIPPAVCTPVLAVMTTAGMYQESGAWLYTVGQPAKSGISGGVVTVSPGKGALGVFSPPLDSAGNSVRSVKVAQFLSFEMGLNMLTSSPKFRRE